MRLYCDSLGLFCRLSDLIARRCIGSVRTVPLPLSPAAVDCSNPPCPKCLSKNKAHVRISTAAAGYHFLCFSKRWGCSGAAAEASYSSVVQSHACEGTEVHLCENTVKYDGASARWTVQESSLKSSESTSEFCSAQSKFCSVQVKQRRVDYNSCFILRSMFFVHLLLNI